jgi:hypothetical protein
MTPLPRPDEHEAYTRESVMAYLRAAEAERQRLEQAITDARARTDIARRRSGSLGGARAANGAGAGCGVPIPVPSLPVQVGGPDPAGVPGPALPEWSGHSPADRRRRPYRRPAITGGRPPGPPRELAPGVFVESAGATAGRHGTGPSTPGRATVIARG